MSLTTLPILKLEKNFVKQHLLSRHLSTNVFHKLFSDFKIGRANKDIR